MYCERNARIALVSVLWLMLAIINPITVRIFDTNYSRVMTKFFDMNLIEGASASTVAAASSSVDKQFEKY